jgi:hypothetical protein
MSKYFIQIIVCSLLFFTAYTQDKPATVEKLKFTSSVQVGILEGQAKNTAAQFQILNGFRKNGWLASIGAGIDYYGGKRSVPLFIDIKRDFRKGKFTPFIYLAGGYNFSWLRANEKTKFWWGSPDNEEKGGVFYDAGAGYKLSFKNNMALGFSAGYSFKQQSEIVQPNQICDVCLPSVPANTETYTYQFRRISIKMHYWF